jgi:hypothetical protein
MDMRTWTVAVVDLGIENRNRFDASLVTRCPSGTLVAGLQARPARQAIDFVSRRGWSRTRRQHRRGITGPLAGRNSNVT